MHVISQFVSPLGNYNQQGFSAVILLPLGNLGPQSSTSNQIQPDNEVGHWQDFMQWGQVWN